MRTNDNCTLRKCVLWVFGYFGILCLATLFHIVFWRKAAPAVAGWLHLTALTLLSIAYFCFLCGRTHHRFRFFGGARFWDVLLALACAGLFYLLLDLCLDPFLEGIFPLSERAYREMASSLLASPVSSALRACCFAPITEELLMRGFVLDGLQKRHGAAKALLISAFLFAVLHFNLLQTFSAFLCGLILGLLYLKSGSVFCCIAAHAVYNLLSYVALLLAYAQR